MFHYKYLNGYLIVGPGESVQEISANKETWKNQPTTQAQTSKRNHIVGIEEICADKETCPDKENYAKEEICTEEGICAKDITCTIKGKLHGSNIS